MDMEIAVLLQLAVGSMQRHEAGYGVGSRGKERAWQEPLPNPPHHPAAAEVLLNGSTPAQQEKYIHYELNEKANSYCRFGCLVAGLAAELL